MSKSQLSKAIRQQLNQLEEVIEKIRQTEVDFPDPDD
jgi:hypothetical protein